MILVTPIPTPLIHPSSFLKVLGVSIEADRVRETQRVAGHSKLQPIREESSRPKKRLDMMNGGGRQPRLRVNNWPSLETRSSIYKFRLMHLFGHFFTCSTSNLYAWGVIRLAFIANDMKVIRTLLSALSKVFLFSLLLPHLVSHFTPPVSHFMT